MSITAGPEPRWLDENQEAAWRAYRRMRALLDLTISRALAVDSGLSDADYDVLSNLSESENGRQRLKVLADRMLWSETRLSHQIRRMQDRDLVARRRAQGDGRGIVVELTDEGRGVLDRAAPDHVETVRQAFIDLLTPEQTRVLRTIAETVIDYLGDRAGPPEGRGTL